MKFEGMRLSTCDRRPSKYTTSAYRLANAGFFYVGQEDIVECFKCHLQVANWAVLGEPVDPLAVHAQRSPDCPFIINNEKENVPYSVDPTSSESPKPVDKNPPTTISDIKTSKFQSFGFPREFETPSTSDESGCIDKYRDERQRLETYRYWPNTVVVRPAELARAGFYYLGTEDRVQCAFCKGVLRNWDPADHAYDEHKKHFPQCPFVIDSGTSGNIAILNLAKDFSWKDVTKTKEEVEYSTTVYFYVLYEYL